MEELLSTGETIVTDGGAIVEHSDRVVTFLENYGLVGVIGIILAFVITQLVKKPIKTWAEKQAKKNNVATQMYTWVISFIPLGVALVVAFFGVWMTCGWTKEVFTENEFPWTKMFIEAGAIWLSTLGAYNLFENFLAGKISYEVNKLVTTANDTSVAEAKTVIANAASTTLEANQAEEEQAKATAKTLKQAQKLEKQKAEAEAAAAKAEAKKAKEIAALQEKLNALQSVTTKTDNSGQPWSR